MIANNASKSKIFPISINDDQKLKNNFSESSSFERIVPPPETKQKDLHNMSNFEIIRNVESSLEDEEELSTSNRGIYESIGGPVGNPLENFDSIPKTSSPKRKPDGNALNLARALSRESIIEKHRSVLDDISDGNSLDFGTIYHRGDIDESVEVLDAIELQNADIVTDNTGNPLFLKRNATPNIRRKKIKNPNSDSSSSKDDIRLGSNRKYHRPIRRYSHGNLLGNNTLESAGNFKLDPNSGKVFKNSGLQSGVPVKITIKNSQPRSKSVPVNSRPKLDLISKNCDSNHNHNFQEKVIIFRRKLKNNIRKIFSPGNSSRRSSSVDQLKNDVDDKNHRLEQKIEGFQHDMTFLIAKIDSFTKVLESNSRKIERLEKNLNKLSQKTLCPNNPHGTTTTKSTSATGSRGTAFVISESCIEEQPDEIFIQSQNSQNSDTQKSEIIITSETRTETGCESTNTSKETTIRTCPSPSSGDENLKENHLKTDQLTDQQAIFIINPDQLASIIEDYNLSQAVNFVTKYLIAFVYELKKKDNSFCPSQYNGNLAGYFLFPVKMIDAIFLNTQKLTQNILDTKMEFYLQNLAENKHNWIKILKNAKRNNNNNNKKRQKDIGSTSPSSSQETEPENSIYANRRKIKKAIRKIERFTKILKLVKLTILKEMSNFGQIIIALNRISKQMQMQKQKNEIKMSKISKLNENQLQNCDDSTSVRMHFKRLIINVHALAKGLESLLENYRLIEEQHDLLDYLVDDSLNGSIKLVK